MKDHVLAANALDRAIHGMDTGSAHERLVPSHWNTANGGGSANIPLMAAVASYTDKPDHYEELMKNYASLCLHHFMLSEPFSWIYSSAIVVSWLQAALVAQRNGHAAVLKGFDQLLRVYFSLLKKMAVIPRAMQDPYTPDLKQMKSPVSMLCGNRSWGHAYGLGYTNGAWLFTNAAIHGRTKVVGTPGCGDGFPFVTRAVHHRDVEELINLEWSAAVDPIKIINGVHATSNRVPFQFFVWHNGDKLAIMGENQDEFVDEDTNSNTPGVLAVGCIGGVLHMLPRWPDPKTGAQRIRQKGVKSDVDYSENGVVHLMSDVFGEQSFRCSPFTTKDLAWAMHWGEHGATRMYEEEVIDPPTGGGGGVEPKPKDDKPSWIERMGL